MRKKRLLITFLCLVVAIPLFILTFIIPIESVIDYCSGAAPKKYHILLGQKDDFDRAKRIQELHEAGEFGGCLPGTYDQEPELELFL